MNLPAGADQKFVKGEVREKMWQTDVPCDLQGQRSRRETLGTKSTHCP